MHPADALASPLLSLLAVVGVTLLAARLGRAGVRRLRCGEPIPRDLRPIPHRVGRCQLPLFHKGRHAHGTMWATDRRIW